MVNSVIGRGSTYLLKHAVKPAMVRKNAAVSGPCSLHARPILMQVLSFIKAFDAFANQLQCCYGFKAGDRTYLQKPIVAEH